MELAQYIIVITENIGTVAFAVLGVLLAFNKQLDLIISFYLLPFT